MLVPTRDWMIVELVEEENELGLILADTAKDSMKDDSAMFKILSVGPWVTGAAHTVDDKIHIPALHVGDVVIMEGALAIAKFKYEREDVFVAKARDIAFLHVEEIPSISLADEINEVTQKGVDC